MHSIRRPAWAGSFYPARAETLRAMVEGFLADAQLDDAEPAPRAIAAPHAGYVYSGPVAGSAYARLALARGRSRTVWLLGPCHDTVCPRPAAPMHDAFATPLGDLAVELDTVRSLVLEGLAEWSDLAHGTEHSLEVQLPFVQVALGDVRIVPLLLNVSPPEAAAQIVERALSDPQAAVVVSTDLSHGLSPAAARERDRATAARVERGEPVSPADACGACALSGLALAARRAALEIRCVDLRHSGDTAGMMERVVGYGAFVATSAEPVATR